MAESVTMNDHFDLFSMEADAFESDVHVLIREALNAALEHLSPKADADLASLENVMKTVTDDDYHEHLVDEHVGVMSQYRDQERFLRNIALVALASRLAHTLLKMARTSEFLKPREGPYGERGDSEFDRLWKEYAERFGLDFDTNAARIAFTEPMQKARNLIVHNGGEANRWIPATIQSLKKGKPPVLDTSFSKDYPQFVQGDGMDAEVRLSQEQLDEMCKAAIVLVRWVAGELDARDAARSLQRE